MGGSEPPDVCANQAAAAITGSSKSRTKSFELLNDCASQSPVAIFDSQATVDLKIILTQSRSYASLMR